MCANASREVFVEKCFLHLEKSFLPSYADPTKLCCVVLYRGVPCRAVLCCGSLIMRYLDDDKIRDVHVSVCVCLSVDLIDLL